MSASSVPYPVDLEPSRIDWRTYATRRRTGTLDVTRVLMAMLVLLLVLPSGQIVPGLTAVGRPALLLGLALAFMWVVSRLHPRLLMRGPQPVRWTVLILTVSTLVSYQAGLTRGLVGIEANAATRSLLTHLVFVGVILACADGIRSRAGLDSVVRVFVLSAGVMAVLGILQSFYRVDLGPWIHIPGLEYHSDVHAFENRGGPDLFRVASTTAHFIEFSTLLAMAVPFGVHVARFGSGLSRRIAVLSTALIVIALPLTISRTGLVALAVALLPMVLIWPWRFTFRVLLGGLAVVGLLAALKPGLFETFEKLFTGWDTDPSIQSRTADYAAVTPMIMERPWLGRGSGTFIPEIYRFLDNQWLGTLIERGVVGVAALGLLHLVAIAIVIVAYRRARTVVDRHLCAALLSAQLLAIAVGFTFDSLSFSSFATTLAIMTGMAGAMWRMTHTTRTVRTAAVHGGVGR